MLSHGEPTSLPLEEKIFLLEALGGALYALAPTVAPGSLEAVDNSVVLLMQALGRGHDERVAQAAIAALGNMAVCSPKWRQVLNGIISDVTIRLQKLSLIHI